MLKNYYLILGVPRDAAPSLIRSAFRELAKRYHPDHGSHESRTFNEISEAYEVLSDPERRARFDRALGQRRAPSSPAPDPAGSPGGAEPEPLLSDPMAVTGRPERVQPSIEALLERFARNFTGTHVPKSEHSEPLDFELILSPEEAARGVTIPFQVPVFVICTRCGGGGHDADGLCMRCEGEGRLTDPRPLDVRVPPGVPPGAILEVSLSSLGIENLWLRVHVRVARH